MKLSAVTLMSFKNTVERILHVPGNYSGGILEMAVVLDHSLTRENVANYVPELLGSLKRHSEVFRNVRLNIVDWESDGQMSTEVRPMSMAMTHSFFSEYEMHDAKKHLETLVAYLKLYHARSKLIILVTDGSYLVECEEEIESAMRPFLDKKMMQVVLGEDGTIDIRYRFRRTV